MMRVLYFWPLWPVVLVAGVGGLVVRMAAASWTKVCSNEDQGRALLCLLSLIQALQENIERLEVDADKWDAYIEQLSNKLVTVKEELLGVTTNSTSQLCGLDRVSKVLDEELVKFLRYAEPGAAYALDRYLPRPGQTWNAFLETKAEDQLRLDCDDISPEDSLQFKLKLKDTLLDSIDELVGSLYQILTLDGTRATVYPDSVETPTQSFKIVKVFYATDREITSDCEYLGKASRTLMRLPDDRIRLQYGWAEVGLPTSRPKGFHEKVLANEEADISKHVVIFSVDSKLRGDLNGFVNCVNGDLGRESGQKLLIYIHGYNVTHTKAVRQAAQLKLDLEFQGPVVLYSWSSKGTLQGYSTDEKSVTETATSLNHFLRSIMKRVKAVEANIVAHSMGNRALISALTELHENPEDVRCLLCPLSQIIFVAADEEPSRFDNLVQKIRERYPLISPDQADSVSNMQSSKNLGDLDHILDRRPYLSVYCSAEDLALALSRHVHLGRRRLGDTWRLFESKDVSALDDYDVIDVTGISKKGGAFQLNHSYHTASPRVLEDIQVLLECHLPAASRPELHRITPKKGKSFYAFEKKQWQDKTASCF